MKAIITVFDEKTYSCKDHRVDTNQSVPTIPTGCFLDYTYCGSKDCNNECGCKMSKEISEAVDKMPYSRVAYSFFCGE